MENVVDTAKAKEEEGKTEWTTFDQDFYGLWLQANIPGQIFLMDDEVNVLILLSVPSNGKDKPQQEAKQPPSQTMIPRRNRNG